MAELGKRAKSFIVLDHHYSAMKSLADVPDDSKVRACVPKPPPKETVMEARRRRVQGRSDGWGGGGGRAAPGHRHGPEALNLKVRVVSGQQPDMKLFRLVF